MKERILQKALIILYSVLQMALDKICGYTKQDRKISTNELR